MSKFNDKKTGRSVGIIAGKTTNLAGKYTNLQLLRRITLANLLFENLAYQSGSTILSEMEKLVKINKPSDVVDLAIECKFEQKLRHTPLYLILLVTEHHKGFSVKDALARICTRPDMTIDVLGMIAKRQGSIKPINKQIKKGLRKAFDTFSEYQIAKYRKDNMEISLVDVVNLVHPKPNEKNGEALDKLVNGGLQAPNTWEVSLSQGNDKRATFERMVKEESLGGLAILRNIRNMKESGMLRKDIKTAISQVNSSMLTPLNFLSAQRIAPEFSADLEDAMRRSFGDYKISGTTILAIDVSGSMGALTSEFSNFSRMDLAFALTAYATYIFEDLIIVYTAGNDGMGSGSHIIGSNSKGFGVIKDFESVTKKIGWGGIFTHDLCEWLKSEGIAKDADRLVVLSDSQDVGIHKGVKAKPDTTPYKSSYIIDISSHTHGIKTGNWTAEITGWSDNMFTYIKELEKSDN